MSNKGANVESNAVEGIGHLFRNREALLGFGLVGVVLIMMVPLNAVMIDAFLVLSMAIGLVVFLIAVYTNRENNKTDSHQIGRAHV